MEAIGGYFSLELPLRDEYHNDAIRLNTGRNCLEYILRARGYKKVYIPYYTCAVILEPFKKLDISFVFYHIDFNLEITDEIQLMLGEALLYTNYFGLKQRYVESLAKQYGNQLIIDNTQAFYAKPIEGIDTFYTCRKYFGVADGAYLYTDKLLDEDFEQDRSWDRMPHLLKRIDLSAEQGFDDFRKVDDGLGNQPIRKMSKLTRRIMQSIDYGTVAKKRRKNYMYLHEIMSCKNYLKLPLELDSVPMVYPYFTEGVGFREQLIDNKIFVACYWSNVMEWTDNSSTEVKLSKNLLPLPIDQRYDLNDINITIKQIIQIINNYE